MHAHIVVTHVGMQHAERTEGAGQSRHEDLSAAECAANGCPMQRTGPTARDQRHAARIMAAFAGEPLHGMQQFLIHQPYDARCGVLDAEAKRAGDRFLDSLPGTFRVDPHRSTCHRTGLDAAEHDLRVGDGRILAAEAIAGRAGIGSGTLRADMQHASFVDVGDCAAASADGVDFHCRQNAGVATNIEPIGEGHLAAGHDDDVATGAADFH